MQGQGSAKRHSIVIGRFGSRFSQLSNQLSYIDDENRGGCYKFCQICECTLIILLICLVWGLLSLPVIFYYVDTQSISMNNSSVSNISGTGFTNSTGMECFNPIQYDLTDQRCHSELMDALSESGCLYNSRQTLSVVRNGQELASQVILGLEFIRASESCLAEATSLICLYAYGLCGTSGVYIQPTSSQCEELRDSLCQTEWAAALQFGFDFPNCNELPPSRASCSAVDGMNSSTVSNTSTGDTEDNSVAPTPMLLECSDGFYRENGSQICIPSCHTWHQYRKSLSVATDIIIGVTAAIGIIAGVFILIMACWRPKRMCKFPGIFVLYMVVDTLIVEILIVIIFIDRPGLFCSEKSLLSSLEKTTPFCVISGAVFQYLLLQIAIWWLFHIFILFWMVFFPFQSQAYRASQKIHYIHVACALIGLIFPLLPIIASMSEFAVQSRNDATNGTSATDLFLSGGLGYVLTRFPPIICNPSDGRVAFYSLILPMDIIQAVGSTALVLILWRVHRQSINKSKASLTLFHFGTAEKKLLLIFLYFEILAAIALTVFTLNVKVDAEFLQSVLEFFLCEQRGHDPENVCSKADIHRFGYPELSLLSYIILGLYAVVYTVYAVDIEEMKNKFSQKKSTRKRRLNASSFNSSAANTKTTSFSISVTEKK